MSRKYTQKGYLQDSERQGRRAGSAPRERGEGPRGRGLGAPTATVFRCARCGRRQAADEVPRDAVCGGCGTDLHTCTHCRHFDSSAPLECRQPIVHRISRKASRNECELFQIKLTQEFAPETESRSDAKKAFDDLFDL